MQHLTGTRSAIVLCKNNNIPVFNLGHFDKQSVLDNIKNFLIEHKVPNLRM